MFCSRQPMLPGSGHAPFITAAGGILLTVFLRWLFAPLLEGQFILSLFLGAVAFSKWYGGFHPALFATLLGAAAGFVFFVVENGEVTPFVITMATYLAVGVGISSFPVVVKKKNAPNNLESEIAQHRITSLALHESNELFQLLVKSVEDYAIFMLDTDGKVISWNKGAERIKGYAADEIIGQSFTRFYLPEDIKNGVPQRALETAIREGHFEGEAWRLRKDGTKFFASVVLTAVRNEGGELIGFAKVTRDITKRRLADEALQKAKAELEQRVLDRMAVIKELEAFSYSVSHDLRAPLRHIKGLSEVLAEDYADVLDAEGQTYLKHIQQAGSRMEILIDELLKLSQLTTGKLDQQQIDLSAVAREICDDLTKHHAPRKINFTIHDTPAVTGDLALLRVVIYNLFDNAVKFTGERATAEIEFGMQDNTFFVRDNGAGFDMKYADRLFGPFQRLHTQSEFPGTGVGLATIQRIIRRHGGRIWVKSELDHGTTFYFTIGTGYDE